MNIHDLTVALDATLADILGISYFRDEFSVENCETWDSINHLRIVHSLEEQFPIRFSIEEIETLTSRRRILSAIAVKLIDVG